MAKIYVTRKIPEVGLAKLRDAGHEVDINPHDRVLSKEELLDVLTAKPYEVIVSLLTDTIDAAVLETASKVRIVANYAVGYNNIDLESAKLHSVTVTNTPGVLTRTVEEFTIALMLAITKRIIEADRFTREGKFQGWEPEMMLGMDLRGKTLGILGAGRIGRGVARSAYHGFGMRIVYADIAQSADLEDEIACEYMDTESLLTEADIVSVHVPLLESTHHMLNAERLSLMKPSAYLINTSRGPVIDEVALVEALKAGKLRGAALDVFEHEPSLTPGLFELDNVILTPHIGSASLETRTRMSEMVAENVLTFLNGETPPHVVV